LVDSQHWAEAKGGIVTNASKAAIMAVLLVFISIFLVVLTTGMIAVWRVFELVVLPTAVVAALLVLYFDWRARMRRHVLAERDEQRKAA
jgi:hypothetical protein